MRSLWVLSLRERARSLWERERMTEVCLKPIIAAEGGDFVLSDSDMHLDGCTKTLLTRE